MTEAFVDKNAAENIIAEMMMAYVSVRAPGIFQGPFGPIIKFFLQRAVGFFSGFILDGAQSGWVDLTRMMKVDSFQKSKDNFLDKLKPGATPDEKKAASDQFDDDFIDAVTMRH